MPIPLSDPILRVFSTGSEDTRVLSWIARHFSGADVLCLSSEAAVLEAFSVCRVHAEDGRARYAVAFFQDPGAYDRLAGRARLLVCPRRFPFGRPVGGFFVAGSDDETVPDLGRFPDAVLAVNRLIRPVEKSHRTVLYLSYYRDASDARQQELEECLLVNALHPAIDRVFVLDETGTLVTPFRNVLVVRVGSRPTFRDFFRFANSVVVGTDVGILINSDVLLGDGFERIRLAEKQVFCLSRHEPRDDGIPRLEVGGGSHDCWVWRGRMVEEIGDFCMGKFLCDGVLAGELHRAGYALKNPAHGLFVYHHHRSGVRNYGHHDLIRGPRTGVVFSRHDNVFRAQDQYDDGTN
ncbi:hypothetical protein EBZ80_01195 [bacterium]|nr:hypothetical protein [bacterium]